MELATQFVFIAYNLAMGTFAFTIIGKTSEDPNRYTGTAITAFMHGLFTLGIVLWWDTTDVVGLVAKLAVLALMWVPLIAELPNIHKPFPTVTLKMVVNGFALCAVRIAVVVAFWVL